jgi:copper(I)-binding protein
MTKLLSILFVLALTACQPGVLRVEEAWGRPGVAGENSGAYFRIVNPGGEDTLLSVVGDVAAAVEIHQTVMEGDIVRMEMQDSVVVPAGGLEFEPGDLHVMLIGLRQDLEPGDSFPLTLNFEQAGPVVVNVEVRQP